MIETGGSKVSIRMLGIDHNKASLQEREVFSFTKKLAAEVLLDLKKIDGIKGCVIISTCNRMELWVSCFEEFDGSIYDFLCRFKSVNGDLYKHCFTELGGHEAVEHLFYLTCGLKSKIIGEDQILTQVKEALEFSRENYCTDNVLETLFRIAVCSAKQVKTNVHLSMANSSVIQHVLHEMKMSDYIFNGKRCLVIGNGEMGKLAAAGLKQEGAEVTVTVRQYRSGIIEIPIGCSRINYGDRLDHIEDYDIILSATASPNMTLTNEQLCRKKFDKQTLFIDLAVPRDIDPGIGRLENVSLYDIDHFKVETISEEMKVQLCRIEEILKTGMEEFICWYECREIIPVVRKVSENAAADVNLRLDKTIRKLKLDSNNISLLSEAIDSAANKVVSRLMFVIRDNVSTETFQECMEALKNVYWEKSDV
jgi:glutamyl-tRNA reductase